jgi:hypothetical protein
MTNADERAAKIEGEERIGILSEGGWASLASSARPFSNGLVSNFGVQQNFRNPCQGYNWSFTAWGSILYCALGGSVRINAAAES